MALYIRKDLNFTVLNFQDNQPAYELLWVKIDGLIRPFIIGGLYHPPRPIYNTTLFIDYIQNCVSELTQNHTDSVIVIAGDANSLPEDLLLSNTGLLSLVTAPTRGRNCLDKIYISEPLYLNIKICKSTVKSDHQAIIAHNSGILQTRSKSSTCISYRRKSPAQHANFLNATNESIFYSTTQITDSQKAFDSFYSIALLLLDIHYPVKSVTITSADPDYMTAEINTHLCERTKLKWQMQLP